MRTTTWTEVSEDIRVRLDLPAFSTTTKPTTAQILRLANQSLQRRDAILSEVYGDDYRTTDAVLTTQADLAYLSLPADFLRLKSLVWLRGTDDPVRLKRATPEDHARLSLLASRSWTNELPMYRFQGSAAIIVLPTPNAAYSITCTYQQTSATITAGTDAIQDGPAWTEWLVSDVCVKVATLREEDPSVFMAERADSEQRIRAQAPDRDELQALSVRDVTGYYRDIGEHSLREWYTLNG